MANHSITAEVVALTISALFILFVVPGTLGIGEPVRPQHGKVVTCYVASWASHRRTPGRFRFEDLRPEHCTHLIYAFAGFNETAFSVHSLNPLFDLETKDGIGTYKWMTGLRKEYPGLKVSLGIGGPTIQNWRYTALAASPASRSTFVASAVKILEMYEFDGLDLVWRYPVVEWGGITDDKQNFVQLVKELNEAFTKKGLLLTAAIGTDYPNIDKSFDIPELSKYLDFLHVWAFGFHGRKDDEVFPNVVPDRNTRLSVEDSIRQLLALGAPAGKLVLGLPMNGYSYVVDGLSNSSQKNPIGTLNQFRGGQIPLTASGDFMAYNEICIDLISSNWTVGWDNEEIIAYAVLDDNVIVFESPRSIAMKTDYANRMNFAGVMTWTVDMDDFRGDCAALHDEFLNPVTGFDYPMMRAINLALARPASDQEDNTTIESDTANSTST